jgi:hypothetical protein
MAPVTKYVCAPTRIRSVTVQATAPLVIDAPPKSTFVLLSAKAVNWSHDPLASVQNLLMLPGISITIPVDKQTKPDIRSIVQDPKVIRIRADILKRATDEMTAAVDAAMQAGGLLVVKSQEGDDGWVVSEIWKKYLQRRFPTAGLNKSFLGTCGDPKDYVTPQAPQSPEPVFWGDTGYVTGDRFHAGALIAINEQKHAVRFCQFGDMVANPSKKPAKINLQINDGHLYRAQVLS